MARWNKGVEINKIKTG